MADAAMMAPARSTCWKIASHGYLVIAPGRVLSGPTATEKPVERKPDPTGKLPPVATTSADVRAGLDWALAQNGVKGGRYAGRIDPALTAASGHSCGGLQALEMARDPRIHAVVIHNSGVFADGSNPIQGITVTKELLKGIHTPIVYFLGGPTDVAFPNGSDDFRKIDHVPAALVNLPVGHGGRSSAPMAARWPRPPSIGWNGNCVEIRRRVAPSRARPAACAPPRGGALSAAYGLNPSDKTRRACRDAAWAAGYTG
jgi:dienelactone hydrolase